MGVECRNGKCNAYHTQNVLNVSLASERSPKGGLLTHAWPIDGPRQLAMAMAHGEIK